MKRLKQITAALSCALLLPACLTTSLWEWAADTYATSPTPVSCGVDTDGSTVILVATSGETEPSFSLRVPVDWSERIEVPAGDSGETVHSPLFLERGPVPHDALSVLTQSPVDWFLSDKPETASIDVLVESGTGYVVVGTAKLPVENHWEKRIAAVVLTPAAIAVDAAVSILYVAVRFGLAPWEWGDDDDDDWGSSSDEEGSGLIFPAHGGS